jgi:uncharacterized repeat protein (TIGR01451 family)
MKKFDKLSVATFAILFALIVIVLIGKLSTRATATAPTLGSVSNFAVLGATTVTNTGSTVLNGDLGLSPGTSITGFPPGTYTGALHQTDGTASSAQTATTNAYNAMSIQSFDVDLTGQDLGGLTLTPGVYKFTSSAQLTGVLTLNAQGDPNAVWIFQIGTTLTTASSSSVVFSNPGVGTPGCNVFWQVGTAATLGTSTAFVGTIIAHTEAVTLNTSATLYGRALSSIAAVTLDTNTITVPVCAIPPVAPTLKLVKAVTNDNGGTALPTAWTLTATGAGGFSDNGGTGIFHTVTAGVGYALSESIVSGYTAGNWSCDSGSLAGSTITLSAGQNVTCTIINNDIAPSLTLDKVVVNNSGGVSTESAWTITATGPTTIFGSGAVGSTDVVSGSNFSAGTYILSESVGPSGYAASSWSCVKNGGGAVSGSSIVLALSDIAVCTITNDDILPGPATLHIIKSITNDNGGTKLAQNFSFQVNGGSVTAFEADGQNDLTLSAGTYTVTEPAVAGYAITYNNCSSVVILSGGSATCTITNNDIAPRLIVTKTVVNIGGGTKGTADFPLSITGFGAVTSGLTNTTTVGAHTVSEISDPGYSASVWGGDCAANGTITLVLGDLKTCTITNTYIAPPSPVSSYTQIIPPLIDVVKVPSPLALPAGPGLVNYTYTLTNIGTVPVTDITMVGDTCSPINLTSGDTNSDAKLDLNEVWIYNCSTTLSATHTNTVTATGWANGISATDIASATVVVGLPIVPPLIHITKVPNPLTLGAVGGTVIYTNKVTNPGTVPLSDIKVTDDKCSPINYISGDTNNDSKLDPTETWTYTCRSNLIRTTTNTATATGTANGLTARDFAIATVIVAAPGLPSTGLPPAPWNIVIIVETFILILTSLVVVLKKHTN